MKELIRITFKFQDGTEGHECCHAHELGETIDYINANYHVVDFTLRILTEAEAREPLN